MIFSKKYPIAFDIGFHDIHALQLEHHRDKFRIQAMYHQKLDRAIIDIKQSRQDLIKALNRIKKNAGFKNNRAVFHFPTHKVISFPIEFPIREDEKMEDAIIKEVEQSLPYPLEDAVIDYPSMSRSAKNNSQKVIIVSVMRSDIEDLLLVFKQAGFRVDAVDFRPISSIRLHQSLFEVSDTPSVICYVGRKESSVQIFNKDRILAMNKFSWGLDQLIAKLNTNLGFSDVADNAQTLLLQHGITSETLKKKESDLSSGDKDTNRTGLIVSRIITPTIEQLVFEFHKILGYIRNKEDIHGIGNIFFYGSAPMIKGLDLYIQNRMNIPAKTVHLLERLDIKPHLLSAVSDDITPFAASLGLAMREISWL